MVAHLRPENAGQTEAVLRVWPFPGRPDLAVPLDACGTGVGQVLAITYALLTADEPMTFLIDEPNSFLHPKATAALLELLKRYPQHQYVIATHSPEVVTLAEPERVYRVDLVDGETQVDEIIQDGCTKPVQFTQLRMLESYLLSSDAIAAVVSEDEARAIEATAIDDWILGKERAGQRFGAKKRRSEDRSGWWKTVDAAKLLSKLFSEITESRHTYRKTSHGPRLADWLLKNDPDSLRPLADELRVFLSTARTHAG